MTLNKKITSGAVVLALVSLLAAGCGTRTATTPDSSTTTTATTTQPAQPAPTVAPAEPTAAERANNEKASTETTTTTTRRSEERPVETARVSHHVRNRVVANDGSRQAYYDYSNQPQQRSFWQKHRDKLTVAGGAVGGALIGSIVGGKKGAAIGALAGSGGSALYTYKIRKKNRQY